jgi:hypothetical protein
MRRCARVALMPAMRVDVATILFALTLSCQAAPVARAPVALDAASSGSTPVIFAPGVISGPAHDAAPAFSPDGQVVYFSRGNPEGGTILVSHKDGDGWTKPVIAPFSGVWSDMEPAMSPDGTFLVFASNRPAGPGGPTLDGTWSGKLRKGHGANLWKVTRSGDTFGAPVRLPDVVNLGSTVYAPAVARSGALYFMVPDQASNRFRLHRSAFEHDAYQPAQPLPFSDGTSTDVDPAVAPDESFLVFGSTRPPAQDMDLFIVFRTEGGWGTPVHLGTEVNAPGSDAEARLSPDSRTLYFSSERVTPVHYPRTTESAAKDLERIDAWDNGHYNLWSVSLAPWLTGR